MFNELERTGQSQVSLSDPEEPGDSLEPKVGVGYNAQVPFDAKHKLIVEQRVTNAGSDLGRLAQPAGAKELLGVERIEAVADKGLHYKGEEIQAYEDTGIAAYIARPQRGSMSRHNKSAGRGQICLSI